MKFTKADIEYVHRALKIKGIGYSPLLEELTDHIICEAEAEMKNGMPLRSAVDKILLTIDTPEFTSLQNTTIESDNHSPNLMIRNLVRMLLRSQRKNIKYSFLNLTGLALGFASFIAITMYVVHEINFDTSFTNSSSLYRVTMSSTVGGITNHIPTSYPTLGPELQSRLPDVTQYTRLINYKYSRLVPTFRVDEKIFYEENVIFADSTFFNLFDFAFREGNPATALLHPNAVVITHRMAEKYFGNASALGKHINFNTTTELEITGILQDLPSQTHMQFDFVIPMSTIASSGMFRSNEILENWQVD